MMKLKIMRGDYVLKERTADLKETRDNCNNK